MNEREFFRRAVQDNLVSDARILTYAACVPERKPFAFRRVLVPMLASLAALLAGVATIPSARAEVLSWFGITRPVDYLTESPEERPPIAVLDGMIATAKPGDTEIRVKEPERDNGAVNSRQALAVSELLQKNTDITIGDTLYDGEKAYITLQMNGLAALPVLENRTGGTLTLVQVDPYRVWDLYENGPGEEYTAGKKPLYERPMAECVATLPDGSKASGFVNAVTKDVQPLFDTLQQNNLLHDDPTEEERQKINDLSLQYMAEHSVSAVVWMDLAPERVEALADGSGTLALKLCYHVHVCEDDDLPDTELVTVELGTAVINTEGYRQLEKTEIAVNAETVTWSGETIVTYTYWQETNDRNDAHTVMTNYEVSLDGLTMQAQPGASTDALGIYDLSVKITLPDSMTGEARKAWSSFPLNPVWFNVLIDGEAGKWGIGSFGCLKNDDGTVTFHIQDLRNLPLDRIDQIRTVTLVPALRYVSYMENGEGDRIDLSLQKKTDLPQSYGAHLQTTEYPEYALTFTIR